MNTAFSNIHNLFSAQGNTISFGSFILPKIYPSDLSFSINNVQVSSRRPFRFLRSTLGERFVIFGDPVVDGIPVHARREDSRFLVTWTGDVQNLRHFE